MFGCKSIPTNWAPGKLAGLAQTWKEKVLAELWDLQWHTGSELSELHWRFGGSIHELRKEGWNIETRQEPDGTFSYALLSKKRGAEQPRNIRLYITPYAAKRLYQGHILPEVHKKLEEVLGG